MHMFKFAATGAIALSMIGTTSAIAAQPSRSAAAVPASAPVTAQNLRTSTPLKRASSQSDEGTPAVGYVLAAVVAAGIVAAAVAGTSDNSSTPSSPG